MTPAKPMSVPKLYDQVNKIILHHFEDLHPNAITDLVALARRYAEAQKAKPVTDERLREAVEYLWCLAKPSLDGAKHLHNIEAALSALQARRDAEKVKCPYGKQDCGECDWSDCKGCVEGHYIGRRETMTEAELEEAAHKIASFGKTNFASHGWVVNEVMNLAKKFRGI